jgi:hypothetical protein
MTDASMAARFAESDFRVGRVLSRTASVLSRHFLIFFVVTAVANLPVLLLTQAATAAAVNAPGQSLALLSIGVLLMIVLAYVSQAVILHAAFQDMRNRPVNLGESLRVGLARFLPIVVLAIILAFLVGLASLLLLIPGLILITMWFVGTPVCVVERRGPWASLKRSAELTKGHRWKIFGLMILLIIISAIVSPLIELALGPVGSVILTFLVTLIWTATWGAYYAIAVAVTYHDLRAAKEGIHIEEIAAVFD